MNVQELYDHITSQMTPEQALMNLLEGTVMNYEHLKFKEGEEIHPAMLIAIASLDMGWNIAIPDGDPNAELNGMIVGTQEYLDGVLKDDDKCCENGCSCSDCQNR